MSKASETSISIEDLGDHRTVTISGPHYDITGFRNDVDRFETPYSKELLGAILDIKGAAWLKDEIERSENPHYIMGHLEKTMRPLVDLTDKVVFDFGSGGGASSISLCRIGAKKVYGVDVEEDSVEMATMRAAECGFSDRMDFRYLEDTSRLPFEDAFFDVILCQGVMEHIPPNLRARHLEEVWRTLKPSGLLFIMETPNRVWPIDGHTTGLPLVPYMPLRMARWFSFRFSGKVNRNATLEQLIYAGIRGVTYWEVRRSLAGCELIENRDVDRYFEIFLSKPGSGAKKKMGRILRPMFKLFEATFCRITRIPVVAFLPNLSFCLRKV